LIIDAPEGKGFIMRTRNQAKQIREAKMLGKSELAKLARVSPLTIDRIEQGMPCRIGSQRRIVLAPGLKLTQAKSL
jgi:DNA-binding XRE family transcriptional regulator